MGHILRLVSFRLLGFIANMPDALSKSDLKCFALSLHQSRVNEQALTVLSLSRTLSAGLKQPLKTITDLTDGFCF
jgi:hypothetical protein